MSAHIAASPRQRWSFVFLLLLFVCLGGVGAFVAESGAHVARQRGKRLLNCIARGPCFGRRAMRSGCLLARNFD
jgi:hypothetical protein